MINQNHLRFLGIAYYVVSFSTAFSLWFTHDIYLILFGWTLFTFNLYQIFAELHDNQINDEN